MNVKVGWRKRVGRSVKRDCRRVTFARQDADGFVQMVKGDSSFS